MTTAAVLPELTSTVHYNTIRIGDVDVFYREAGSKTAPVLLLLHGFPTSSNMFRNLIPRLAGSFRVIAPDYPGYGFSSMPDRKDFSYTFENMTTIVEQLACEARPQRILALRDGLRRAHRIQACPSPSGEDYGPDCAEW
jgi:pimeloyl-ACP methyl ester carboxylesterase